MKFIKRIVSGFLILALVTSNTILSNATIKQQLEVHFINVGQGDSTYIELPDGTDILIDAGKSSDGNTVVNYLKNQEKNIELDYLIATHPDSDHVGGMKEVFNQLNVKNFYYPSDVLHNTETWKNILNLANMESCNIKDAKSGHKFNSGEVTIEFIQPNKDYTDNNDDSAVILIDYNNTEILITGDISDATEKDMVNQNLVPDLDVLKVAHHGSQYSSSTEFLNIAKAEEAIISVGSENSYGHPHSSALERLSSSGSRVWRTDISGNIVVTSDGNNILIDDALKTGNTSTIEGWKLESGNWYFYKNGIKQTGWIMDKGVWYYTNSNGVMQVGWKQISGKWYYLKSNGAMATGWELVNNKWYYLKPSGEMATGWESVNNKWYYLKSSGEMATGWELINNTWYYLRANGEMATGWESINGSWYYLKPSGAMATGWLKDGYDWYYMKSNGAMCTGWQSIGGSWYYFYGSGVMASDTIIDGWQIDHNGVGTKITNNGQSNNHGQANLKTVYITPSGKSYHSNENCTSLKRSSSILSVSLQEAINRGKSDPCNLCVR